MLKMLGIGLPLAGLHLVVRHDAANKTIIHSNEEYLVQNVYI